MNDQKEYEVDREVFRELQAHETQHWPHIVRFVERHHPEYHPGVPEGLVDAYAAALDNDPEAENRNIGARLVDGDVWQSDEAYYRIGDNVSAYPASWHDRYAETESLAALVEIMDEQMGRDIVRNELLLALESIAGIERRRADGMLTAARRRGDVIVEPYTNPEAFVYPA